MFLSTNSDGPQGRVTGRVLVLVAILAAFGLGLLLRGGGSSSGTDANHATDHASATETENTIWTCSMHPQIKLPKPGKCPICFMDLIPLETDAGEDLGPRALVLSESAVALADIQTVAAESKSVASRVRLIGNVDFDETLYRVITTRVPGRIDTLFVDFTGVKVSPGERLASLYSPDLYATQWELLNAVQAEKDLQNSTDEFMRESAHATVVSAQERVRLWGLTEKQINSIIAGGKALDHLDIISPIGGVVVHKSALEGMYVKTGTSIYTVADLSRVWVTLNAYETDLPLLREGQAMDFTVEALPGRTFSGEIIFIDPILDSKTRTIQVRVEVSNEDGALKPGMFVNAVVNSRYEGPKGGSTPVVIPATAPMITGERAVVYVRLPNHEKPTFAGRVVTLGPRVGDSYIVESGLDAGEMVVTKGNFKIDSALQIQAKPSMMNPEGGGPTPGHHHGGSSSSADSDKPMAMAMAEEASQETLVVPEAFKDLLGDVLQSYLQMQEAMAGDDDTAAETAASASVAALKRVDMELLEGATHLAWMREGPVLEKKLQALATAQSLAARRQSMRPASEALWAVLEKFGYSRSQPVRYFHCPMAIDEAGGNWIQLAKETSNPYFGAAMLRCGSQIDSLQTSSPVEGR